MKVRQLRLRVIKLMDSDPNGWSIESDADFHHSTFTHAKSGVALHRSGLAEWTLTKPNAIVIENNILGFMIGLSAMERARKRLIASQSLYVIDKSVPKGGVE